MNLVENERIRHTLIIGIQENLGHSESFMKFACVLTT